MKILETRLPGVLVVEPRILRDARGYFLETWSQQRYADAGIPEAFVQDNLSNSARGVLRGLHLQVPSSQSKLIAVLTGAIFDVAVDVRDGSPTFGQWVGADLDAEDHRQLLIPKGFAHGFIVTAGPALVAYKVDVPYAPVDEMTVAWNDPDLAISWPMEAPILSGKDREGLRLREIPRARLPRYSG